MAKRKKKTVKVKRKCCVRNCTEIASDRPMCMKHYRRQWRKNNPAKDKYNNLKQNAKRRKISFALTFEEFVAFCKKHNYLERCGRKASAMTIDRKRQKDGYQADNLQVLTLSANAAKYNAYERNRAIDPDDIPDTVPDDSPVLRHIHEPMPGDHHQHIPF